MPSWFEQMKMPKAADTNANAPEKNGERAKKSLSPESVLTALREMRKEAEKNTNRDEVDEQRLGQINAEIVRLEEQLGIKREQSE